MIVKIFIGILGEPMEIVCLDLEGVLVPEIWINFAKKTGIKELEPSFRT